jgi:tetratricopeptide (TPR) repeat protein
VEAVLQRLEDVEPQSQALTDYFRAEQHRARDEFEDATRYYQRVLGADPQNYWALTGLGHCYMHTGQPRLAWLAYQTCIGLRPRSPWPWTQRGVAAAMAEEGELALQDFEHALQMEADFLPARFNRGLLFAMGGDHRSAVNEFNLCLERALNTGLLNARARSWLELDEPAHALNDVQAALELQPRFAPALVTRAKISRAGAPGDRAASLQAAARDLDLALELAPDLVEAHIERARVMQLLGSTTEATNAYTRALEIVRFDPVILRERARLFAMSGQKREAVSDYALLIRAGKASAEDLGHSGDCHADMQLWREAIHDYSEALRQKQNDPGLLFRRAQCYIAQGDFAAAHSDCQRVLQIRPHDPAAQDLMARIQSGQSSR